MSCSTAIFRSSEISVGPLPASLHLGSFDIENLKKVGEKRGHVRLSLFFSHSVVSEATAPARARRKMLAAFKDLHLEYAEVVMHWHGLSWMASHSHLLFAYGYDVIGGLLIFMSSAVTETSMPAPERRKHWIIFGLVAVVYAGVGIGIRHDEIATSISDRQNTTDVIKTLKDTFPLVMSLTTDIAAMKKDLEAAKQTGDPNAIADLKKKAEIAQKQADAIMKLYQAATAPKGAPPVDQEVAKLRREATDVIYRLNDRLGQFYRDPNVSTPQKGTAEGRKFAGMILARDFQREKTTELRDRLIGRIRTLPIPPDGRNRDSFYSPSPLSFGMLWPQDAEMQISDLRLLLNEMERENYLSLSCTEIKLHWGLP